MKEIVAESGCREMDEYGGQGAEILRPARAMSPRKEIIQGS